MGIGGDGVTAFIIFFDPLTITIGSGLLLGLWMIFILSGSLEILIGVGILFLLIAYSNWLNFYWLKKLRVPSNDFLKFKSGTFNYVLLF